MDFDARTENEAFAMTMGKFAIDIQNMYNFEISKERSLTFQPLKDLHRLT